MTESQVPNNFVPVREHIEILLNTVHHFTANDKRWNYCYDITIRNEKKKTKEGKKTKADKGNKVILDKMKPIWLD